jgi:hypothetical protein
MPIVQIEAELSLDALACAASQLSGPDLDRFVAQMIALRGQRSAPSLPKEEADLLLQINQAPPSDVASPYRELVAKRRAGTLTPEEHEPLIELSEEMENWNVRRVECLAELARRRGVSLTDLMQQLGIEPPPYE